MPTTGWDGDKNYALFDDKMRVNSGRESNHNRILDWRDMLVKASYSIFTFSTEEFNFYPTGGSKCKCDVANHQRLPPNNLKSHTHTPKQGFYICTFYYPRTVAAVVFVLTVTASQCHRPPQCLLQP